MTQWRYRVACLDAVQLRQEHVFRRAFAIIKNDSLTHSKYYIFALLITCVICNKKSPPFVWRGFGIEFQSAMAGATVGMLSFNSLRGVKMAAIHPSTAAAKAIAKTR